MTLHNALLKHPSLLTMKTIEDLENDMILTACIMFISLPVTVASAERSFSKNSMGQERLSNIKRSRTHELNVNKIIDDFANKKARKKNFMINFVCTFPICILAL
ncbi:zinc finger MYM-type protein 1-like [Aphis craccivora]|uniref:Zinc finger MYM-type protein 1-like n=1 Tax=Aphis craccivora TaxID=307492 RepID=A0A6G0VL62_APHCR|nr:zinc finger MYM-type protein 1-like [Aphis craccivora]